MSLLPSSPVAFTVLTWSFIRKVIVRLGHGRSERNCLFLCRRGGWPGVMKTTETIAAHLSLASLTCSRYTGKVQTASLKQPLPFPSLQAWSRAGHTHLQVLPLLWWELGPAVRKIWENPIITKAYVPRWAECEKSTTNLTRQTSN